MTTTETANPLLDWWLAAMKADPCASWRDANVKIDDTVGDDDRYREWKDRSDVRRRWAYAIPDAAALDAIVRHAPPAGIVEIGAGSGYWAKMINERGVAIICYDNFATDHFGRDMIGHFYPVKHGSSHAAAKHPNCALFLCWPPISRMAAYALRAWQGSTVIYIGEGRGDCTANDEFFNLLDKKFEKIDQVAIPHWSFTHDDMTVWKRIE